MALKHAPRIVTDGLVLALDAANPKSYPGSGTTWKDLSGNGNDGTLTNGPTFSGENAGSIAFDGVDDYVDCGTETFTSNEFSIEVIFDWADFNTSTIGFLTAGTLEQLEIHTGGGSGTNGLRFIPYDFPDNTAIDATNIITSGINSVTFTASYVGQSIAYKNGMVFDTSGTSTPVTLNSSQTITIGRRSNTSYPYNGKIYSIKIYNRTLTPEEVLQNYNATKSRFYDI